MTNNEARLSPSAGAVVFQTCGLTKVYDLDQVEVHALRGVDVERYADESSRAVGALRSW